MCTIDTRHPYYLLTTVPEEASQDAMLQYQSVLKSVTGLWEFLRLDCFYRKSQGFILVYSINSRASFDSLKSFRNTVIRETSSAKQPLLMLVGNKSDRTSEREVEKAEGEALAREFGCQFIEVSTKTGRNVETLLIGVLRKLRANREKEAEAQSSSLRGGHERDRKVLKCTVM